MTSKTIPFVCPRATGDGHLGTRYAYAPWATQNMPRGSDRTSEQGSHSLGHMEKNTPKLVTSSYSFPYQKKSHIGGVIQGKIYVRGHD